MKKIYSFFTCFILLFTYCHSQTVQQKNISGDIKTDLNVLLPSGKITVDVMDGVRQNTRQDELTKKFQEGIKNNYDWFLGYMKTAKEGQPLAYHRNFNLTEKEYQELQGYMNDVSLVSTGTEEVTVVKGANTIEFKAQGKLEILEAIKIDLKKNIVLIGDYELAFSDLANITDDKNGLKSKWKGYNWKFEEPKDLDMKSIKDIQTLKIKVYKFTIGKIEKTGKTYMSIKGQEIENGERQVNFELPLIF